MYKKTCSAEQQNYCDLTETIELMAKKYKNLNACISNIYVSFFPKKVTTPAGTIQCNFCAETEKMEMYYLSAYIHNESTI